MVTLSYDYSVKGRYTRLTRLQVKGVPAGATVKVTCKKGCSRKSYTVTKKKRGTVSLKTGRQASGCGPGRPSVWWSAAPATSPRSRR